MFLGQLHNHCLLMRRGHSLWRGWGRGEGEGEGGGLGGVRGVRGPKYVIQYLYSILLVL